MELHFYKYQGTGNDFVLIDNRGPSPTHLSEATIKKICDRRFGIGADGLMMLNEKEGYDFEMVYFNADGREGSMCGNGGRCITRFAHDMGIFKTHYHFLAVDGPHEASIDDGGLVSLKMNKVFSVKKYEDSFVLDTGSPHLVQAVTELDQLDVAEEGRKIRYNKDFATKGINVNFVEVQDDNNLKVRTYERGVENETYSCGTGVTASALVFFHHEMGFNSINIETLGGQLTVEYQRNPEGAYEDIWLKGPAERVFEGTILIEQG